MRVTGSVGAFAMSLAVIAAGSLWACGDAGRTFRIGASDAGWDALYWVNSNSGPTFQWSLDGFAADAWVAAPMNGKPTEQDGAGACAPFGGSIRPGKAAASMQKALPPGASLTLWMQPRDDEFAGVPAEGLSAAVERELAWFQSCVVQDWPDAPTVSGFLCVHEQRLGGAANCATLAPVFQQGVRIPGSTTNAAYGVLSDPQGMSATGLTAALGEMYEPAYFAPSGTCPASSDGTAYGTGIGTWIAGSGVVPAEGSVAVPVFGGPSATCPLGYGELPAAAAALLEQVPNGLAGLAVWS